MNAVDIEWGAPPARGLDVWFATADALRSRPGEWARIKTGMATASIAGNLRAGRTKAFPAGEFEFTTRKTDDGTHDLYARYTGTGS